MKDIQYDNLDPENEVDQGKMYKISYKINILPMVDEYIVEDEFGKKTSVNQGYSFLERCTES